MKLTEKLSEDLIREVFDYAINRCKEESIKNNLTENETFNVIADMGINIGCMISMNCLNILADKRSKEAFLLGTIVQMTENLRENFEMNHTDQNTH